MGGGSGAPSGDGASDERALDGWVRRCQDRGAGFLAWSGWTFIRRFLGVPFRKLPSLERAIKDEFYGEELRAGKNLK